MMDAPIFSDALGRQSVTLLMVCPHPDDESILVNWLIHLFPMIFWRCKRILGISAIVQPSPSIHF
jgi:hypothetical protein